jgi:hypothetical protein
MPIKLTLVFKPEDNKGALLLREERRRLGEVVEGKEGQDSHDDRRDALEDEDPAPPLQPAGAIHLGDGKRQQAAEGAGHGGGGEEEGLAQLDLVPAVPHRQVVGHPGKEAGLGDSEEEARGEEAREGPHDAHERHDSAPRDHDEGQPARRAELFEKQVGGDFEGGICQKEYCKAEIVLVRAHSEILLKALDLGVADVAACVMSAMWFGAWGPGK